jgi:ferric-dicitrate binding protein FerR (iron transport regulator)
VKHSFNPTKSWEKVKNRYYFNREATQKDQNDKPLIKSRYLMFLRIASVFVFAFILGAVVFQIRNKTTTGQFAAGFNEVVAPLGSKTRMVLSDGTKVWLNAGSKLRYPVNFMQSSRDVYLEGEGYFEVTKNKERKFIVHTSLLNIQVFGTEFNVKAYPEEEIIETTLVNGSVAIENSETSKLKLSPVFLVPNQMARFHKSDESLTITSASGQKKIEKIERENLVVIPKIDPVVYTSWKDARWVIQSETLESLSVKLERKYDVEIEFNDAALKRYKFSGTLADETLEQVLNVIKITAPINYKIENKKVYLTINNSLNKAEYDKMLINQ